MDKCQMRHSWNNIKTSYLPFCNNILFLLEIINGIIIIIIGNYIKGYCQFNLNKK